MKKIYPFLAITIALVLGYYFVIEPSEFRVNFIARTLPGNVIETIRIWNKSLDEANISKVDSFSSLSQRIIHEGREYVYQWRFRPSDDSTTEVSIAISEPGNSFWNKLLVPFSDRPIEQDANKIVRQYYDVLKSHLQITRVNLIGVVDIDSKFCVCSRAETLQAEKASGMMRDFLPLSAFVDEMGLVTDGPPMIKIQSWSHSAGMLKFDFCFPIKRTDVLPDSRSFTYQQIPSLKALKAEYFGNYITSDRAWYELFNFANQNGYKITGLPVEVFHNNPNLGMNEKEWKAEIFLPVEGTSAKTGDK